MTFPIDAAIRSGVLVLIGLIAAALLRRCSAGHRHAVLAAAIAGAAAVGPLAWIVPGWDVPVAPVAAPRASSTRALTSPHPVNGVVAVEASEAAARPGHVLFWVWAAGCGVWSSLLLAGLWRLRRTSSAARSVVDDRCLEILADVAGSAGIRRPVRLLCAATPDSPATWGVLQPRVVLPAEALRWNEARLRVVLRHELAHVRRQDWLVQICAEAVRTVYWFNPLMWIACSRLRRESEQACDNEVLDMGISSHDYAAELLELVRASRRARAGCRPVAPVAAPSTLERRIAAMLNPSVNRTAPSRLVVAIAAALLLAVTLPVSALRAAQTGPLPLEGFIYDPSGAVLPQVKVTLADAKGQQVETETDPTGHFEFASVAPGPYVLEAAVPGFKSLRQELQLRNARDWDRAVMLQLGELSETIIVSATRTAGAVPAPQGPVPVRVGGNIRVPTKLKHVSPVYPPSMRDAGREGIVPMEAVIDRDGAVQSIRVLSATIHPDLALAAADAVRQWRFAPTLLNGTPVEVRMKVTITFSLED